MPLKPFCGTIGLAPAEPGQHSVVPPRRMGGNMDIRDLAAGTVLYLPVEVKGGLFSVGDTHATQGDGEVCGTAIESPCSLAARFELEKAVNLPFPRFTTQGPVARHMDAKGYEATTGIGPDLMTAARSGNVAAVKALISKGANVNAVDGWGRTPLIYAARNGRILWPASEADPSMVNALLMIFGPSARKVVGAAL